MASVTRCEVCFSTADSDRKAIFAEENSHIVGIVAKHLGFEVSMASCTVRRVFCNYLFPPDYTDSGKCLDVQQMLECVARISQILL